LENWQSKNKIHGRVLGLVNLDPGPFSPVADQQKSSLIENYILVYKIFLEKYSIGFMSFAISVKTNK
jgi:hypothetical protein